MSTPGKLALDEAERVIRLLDSDQRVKVERRETSIVFTPSGKDTYGVTVYDEGDQAMISCERWHSHYDDPAQLAFCVLWLLTPFYRVVHEFKGGLLAAVWIERYEAEGWVGMEPVFFLNPDHPADWALDQGEGFSRRYLAQNILSSPQPYDKICPGAELDATGLPKDLQLGTWTVAAEGPESLDIE